MSDDAITTAELAAVLIRDALQLLDAVAYVDDQEIETGELTVVPHDGHAFRVNVTMRPRY